MTLDATGIARYSIVDSSGRQYHACCPICAFKLIKTYGALDITSFCDYNGPSYPITISAKMNGSVLTITPQTAMVILGGSCSKNRLVYNSATADALLASPNNGSSKWLSPMQNATVLANATRIGLAQAILQYAGGATSACETCGMTVDVTGQARFKIFDAIGTLHIACCPICAFKLLRNYGNLNFTAFCDYYGPNYPITITARNNGTEVTVTPPDALVILGGGCTKNRIMYNSTAADLLLAPPNNGTSKYLSSMQNGTVAENATRMGVAQSVTQNGDGVAPSPSPTSTASPTSAPTSSPEPSESPSTSTAPSNTPKNTANPTESPTSEPISSPAQSNTPSPSTTAPLTIGATLQCEICGMDVTPESQARYRVTDGNGNVHYVECFMCALQTLNDYATLHIATYCDWYGPNYPITIDSTNYGQTVTVTPLTAMFLRGGSCVTARAAYNQTAADNLLANGFSQYTSPKQRYDLPSSTQVKLVTDAISTWYAQPNATSAPTTLTLVVITAVGAIVIAASLFAFKKLKNH
jgi:hypothetical protein